jgi:tRNA 2-thiouridine synthesizing protein A
MTARTTARPDLHYDAEWDAGDMGCGELLLDLRFRLREMPTRVLKLTARDPGAILDLPAWCRMTGDTLLHHDPETFGYWIQARP